MKTVLYHEVVFRKGEIIGTRPLYGVGPWWLMGLISIVGELSHWFLSLKFYLEKNIKEEKGKIEKDLVRK